MSFHLPELDLAASGALIRRVWGAARRLPGGRRLFSRLVGTVNPYTGSMGAQVLDLGPGRVRVALRQRRAVENHVGSIHAVALTNLTELTTGLAVMAAMPPHLRGIPVGLSITFLHKARGRITCACTLDPALAAAPGELEAHGTVTDATGREVARGTARWTLGERKPR